ncbi:alpha/beta fold hydrolase [Halostreptopolyspora alba]|uniref:Alpha/beta hydrolase n=1 Tax=Halostreptopolyspora alba TaxID=2487137 RepID=A0A3N0ECK7_9ACTN|nr:alpha/beta hydrolase [Nocardiopsaceae bacterium YIM 96095]
MRTSNSVITPVDRDIVVDGVRLAYCDHGSGEPVVLVHGTPSHSVIWRDVLPRVVAAGNRVVAFDLLGYGRSERPVDRDTSVTAQADLLERLLATLGIGEVTLVGHDLGGAIGQILATRAPERMRRLMLVDTVSFDSWPSETWRRIIADHPGGAAGMAADEFEELLAAQLAMTVNDRSMSGAVLDAYLAPYRSTVGRVSFFEHQVRHYDSVHTRRVVPHLGRLRMPVRIVWGGADSWQPASYAARLHEAIPGSTEPVIIDGAGHFLPEEAPDTVADEILRLLDVPVGPARP